MTITKLTNICYKIEADEGKVFVSKDRDMVYDDIMYCPKANPDVDEVISAEAEEIKAKLEAKYKGLEEVAVASGETVTDEVKEDNTTTEEADVFSENTSEAEAVEDTTSDDDLVSIKLTKAEAEKLREYLASK